MRKDVAMQVVPKYPELSVDKVWAQLSQNEQAKKYFPDYAKGQAPERDYLFGIASSLFPDALRELVEEARIKRAKYDDPDNDELIEMTPDIKDKILSVLTQKSKLPKHYF